ncbi:hypothetical protein niasHT_011251 [Heterodera trifolii]|uniref:Uncharacterized protein n=1 Tax=Heterodera trifolii TaxID=157864 RepID=A0ABD2L6D3_9BILA
MSLCHHLLEQREILRSAISEKEATPTGAMAPKFEDGNGDMPAAPSPPPIDSFSRLTHQGTPSPPSPSSIRAPHRFHFSIESIGQRATHQQSTAVDKRADHYARRSAADGCPGGEGLAVANGTMKGGGEGTEGIAGGENRRQHLGSREKRRRTGGGVYGTAHSLTAPIGTKATGGAYVSDCALHHTIFVALTLRPHSLVILCVPFSSSSDVSRCLCPPPRRQPLAPFPPSPPPLLPFRRIDAPFSLISLLPFLLCSFEPQQILPRAM